MSRVQGPGSTLYPRPWFLSRIFGDKTCCTHWSQSKGLDAGRRSPGSMTVDACSCTYSFLLMSNICQLQIGRVSGWEPYTRGAPPRAGAESCGKDAIGNKTLLCVCSYLILTRLVIGLASAAAMHQPKLSLNRGRVSPPHDETQLSLPSKRPVRRDRVK